jgi:hypothetical protein
MDTAPAVMSACSICAHACASVGYKWKVKRRDINEEKKINS